jgi:hypothetical protein
MWIHFIKPAASTMDSSILFVFQRMLRTAVRFLITFHTCRSGFTFSLTLWYGFSHSLKSSVEMVSCCTKVL